MPWGGHSLTELHCFLDNTSAIRSKLLLPTQGKNRFQRQVLTPLRRVLGTVSFDLVLILDSVCLHYSNIVTLKRCLFTIVYLLRANRPH